MSGYKSFYDSYRTFFSPLDVANLQAVYGAGDAITDTNQSDKLAGTTEADVIIGNGGSDRIRGSAGADLLIGDGG